MSGHSKWANIKHRKAAQDSKRGAKFTKLSKEITVAAKVGGSDAGSNPRLRTLLEKARNLNMPKDNVDRAIKKGTGELPGVNYEAITYEGYGPYGIAIIVETLTDNKNRTVADLRHLFSKHGGSLGESGSVGWMFEKKGVIRAASNEVSEDALLEKLIDFDVEDIKYSDNYFCIHTDPKSVDAVKKAVESSGLKIDSADLELIPKTMSDLQGESEEKAIEFLQVLEDFDDVQNVYTNLA
ncbi:MAG: YebC/PmpR family DNA-binding transcriptional regulator [Candidatus Babeliales bacterium]